jgi:hypothetical protein
LSFSKKRRRKLCRNAGAGRTNFCAGTAILALGWIDNVKTIPFGDGIFGTFGFASAAADAISGNFIGHFVFPFVFR